MRFRMFCFFDGSVDVVGLIVSDDDSTEPFFIDLLWITSQRKPRRRTLAKVVALRGR